MRRPYLFIILITLFIVNQAFTGSIHFSGANSGAEEGSGIDDTSAVAVFERYIHATYATAFPDSSLSYEVFRLGMIGQYNLELRGKVSRPELLTIIDFSRSSFEERMFIVDLRDSSLVKRSLVAHGMRSGTVEPSYFSNSSGSKKSSIGFYVTGETYNGKHKYSLKLDGQDANYNTNARNRGVVIHGADYVSQDYIERNGRLGRSFGCPAIPREENQEIVDLLTGGTCVFIYAKNQRYLSSCRYLDLERAARHFMELEPRLAARLSQGPVNKS